MASPPGLCPILLFSLRGQGFTRGWVGCHSCPISSPDLVCIPVGIEFVVAQLKSVVLTLGLIDLRLTVEQAVLLSRLEEEYQVRC